MAMGSSNACSELCFISLHGVYTFHIQEVTFNHHPLFGSHGSAFGKGGECEHVPTQATIDVKSTKGSFMKKAVEEHDGLIWTWRGNVLEANARKLPHQTRKDASTYPCDMILDYNVNWQYIVENNLDSPHLFWLHNGSVPPGRLLNFFRDKVNQVKLKFFRDNSGHGYYGQTAGGKIRRT